ncbi:MAG: hypothetical protein R2743_12035 [Ilumatobacteraceae bacterium]
MTILPADPALLDHLVVEFGEHGRRAVEFLQTAEALLALESSTMTPRLPETAAYCLREAMKTIPDSQKDGQAGRWRSASRAVTDARRRFDLVRGVPGEDEDGALRELLDAIDGLEQVHGQEGIHQRRLIAIMVSRTGTVPLSAGTEPVRRYQELLEEFDSALHNQATIEVVRALWDRCILALRQLFLPPDVRHRELSSLGDKPTPGPADAEELLALLAGPNHLQYFLSRVADPAWLDALIDSGVLDPPAENGPWPVFAAIERLAPSHGAEVVAWLHRMYKRHATDSSRSWFVARAAVDAGPDALPLVHRAISDHGVGPAFAHLGMLAVERSAPDSDLVESLADLLLNREAWQNLGYADPIIQQVLAGLNWFNAARRIQLLCWKVGAVGEDEGSRRWLGYERAGSIADWRDDADDRFSSLLAALVEELKRAWDWIPLAQMLDMVDAFPDEVRCRVRAWLLAIAPASDPTAMIEELALAIATRDPTGDDLSLIDRVVASTDPSLYVQSWIEALGVPPSVTDVAQALATHDVPLSVRRAFHWSGLLPESVIAAWLPVASVMGAAYGRPGRQALQKRARVEAGWGRSPMTADELGALQPIEAAAAIAAWRPDPSEFLVSARELARTLEEVVKNDPGPWVAEPLRIATELRHPTYIHHYLRAVAESVKNQVPPPVAELLDVIGLVRAHPWQADVLGKDDFDYDARWDEAEQAGVEALRALADSDLGFAGRDDEVWAILEAEVRDRSHGSSILSGGRDPLDHAINRRCTRALDAVLAFMAYEFRTAGSVRPEPLMLLDETLRLDGADGAEHRAILATRLGFLQHVAPEWFERSAEVLFGAQAPEGLAQTTADLAVKWGRPNRWLHEHHRDLLLNAVLRGVDNAIDQLLIAMLWEVPGYTVEDNIEFLRQSPELLSKAGEMLGRLLRHQDAEASHVAVAARFWESAIEVGDSASLAGFGWMAEVERLQDERWAELVQKTLAKTAGKIDWAHKVAERTASMTPSATTLSIMNSLVRGIADEWDRRGTAEKAAAVLVAATNLAGTTEYERLRTTLLERGAI